MNTTLNSLDPEISDAINETDWYSVNELEAKNFSISYNLYNDTTIESSKIQDVQKRTFVVTISSIIVCVIAIFFNLSTMILAFGIIGTLFVHIVFDLLHVSAITSLKNVYKDILLAELKSIKNKQFSIIDREDEDDQGEVNPE